MYNNNYPCFPITCPTRAQRFFTVFARVALGVQLRCTALYVVTGGVSLLTAARWTTYKAKATAAQSHTGVVTVFFLLHHTHTNTTKKRQAAACLLLLPSPKGHNSGGEMRYIVLSLPHQSSRLAL